LQIIEAPGEIVPPVIGADDDRYALIETLYRQDRRKGAGQLFADAGSCKPTGVGGLRFHQILIVAIVAPQGKKRLQKAVLVIMKTNAAHGLARSRPVQCQHGQSAQRCFYKRDAEPLMYAERNIELGFAKILLAPLVADLARYGDILCQSQLGDFAEEPIIIIVGWIEAPDDRQMLCRVRIALAGAGEQADEVDLTLVAGDPTQENPVSRNFSG